MILAAGRGERMGALTEDVPKPLLEIGGEALIERHLRSLGSAGITEVVINLSYRGAQIRERIDDGRRFGVTVRYSDEGEPPLETAGGIVQALPLLGAEPFGLISADVLTTFDFAQLRQAGRMLGASAMQGLLVLVPNPAHHPQGDFSLDGDGRLSLTAPRLTYAGIGVFRPSLFSALDPGRRPLRPVLEGAVARRELGGVLYQGDWYDIGTPQRLASARAALGG